MILKYLSLFTILILASCSEDAKINTALNGNTETNTTLPNGGGGGGGGSAEYCTGTTQDGSSDQSENNSTPNSLPLLIYEVNLAGEQSWKLGNSLVDNTEDLEQAFQALSNDGAYYIRLKARESIIPPRGEEFCPGRQTNIAWMTHYQNLRFKIYRHGYAVKFDSNMKVTDYYSTTGQGGIYLASTDLVGSNKCSDIIKVPPLGGNVPPDYTVVTIFEIRNVTSDAQCIYCQERGTCSSTDVNGFYCPDYAIRKADCWSAIVQVSTNKTHFWKGKQRF